MAKNDTKSKQLLSNIIDFLIFTGIALTIFASGFFLKLLLYPERNTKSKFKIETEPLQLSHAKMIQAGDVIYDPITKRALGEIYEVERIDDGERVKLVISFLSEDKPKGKSLRTKDVWFYYKEAGVSDE